MLRLPHSPRVRRRLGWVAGLCALVVAGTLVAVLLPEHAPPPPAPGPPHAPELAVAPAKPARLTAADRRAIDHALDVFLPAAMERKDLALAWTLAGPELRSAQTKQEWLGGSTPVPYYLAKETTFHTWQAVDVEARSVIFNLVLHPGKGETAPSTEFSGMVVRHGTGWRVNRLYTIATFNVTKTTSEVGPADFGALGGRSAEPSTHNTGAIGNLGLLPIVVLLALVLLVPLGLGAVALHRARRFRRATAAASRDLPTLPSRYRPG